MPILSFALCALLPVTLAALAVIAGGGWAWLAVGYMGFAVAALDRILPEFDDASDPDAELPGSNALLAAIGIAALLILPLVCLALTMAPTTGRLGPMQGAALFLATGFWLGQVAHPAAHELIHRADRRLFRLGQIVYSVLLIGHHASSHRLVHHVHVATPKDPATARAGQGFWRFLWRAEIDGFRKGLAAETALRARGSRRGLHPYVLYLAVAGLALGLALALGGVVALAIWIGLALHAQVQIHLADYVQHYGLSRRILPDGRIEPVGPRHSWNAGHWFSGHMMLNAPRHSDHHAHPTRPYPALRLPPRDEAPRLPWPLPLACTLALVPPLWRRAMRPHLAEWNRIAADGLQP